jgi:hypothetical protein
LAQASRSSGFHHLRGQGCSPIYETSLNVCLTVLDTQSRFQSKDSRHLQGVQTSSMVVKKVQPNLGFTFLPASVCKCPYNRCIFNWLGRGSGRRSYSKEVLEISHENLAFKQSWASSSSFRSPTFSTLPEKQSGLSKNSSDVPLSQQIGRHPFPSIVCTGLGPFPLVQGKQHPVTGRTRTGDQQCTSRCSVLQSTAGSTTGPSRPKGVVPPSLGHKSVVHSVGLPSSGSVCITGQSQAASLVLSPLRASSEEGQCVTSPMGSVQLCFPSTGSPKKGHNQNQKGQSSSPSDSPLLASESMGIRTTC